MHVLYSPAEYESIDPRFWEGKAAVVIDVLRATSTMVTALACGYTEIQPCRGLVEARNLRGPGVVLGGERGGLPPEGFDKGNSPLEYQERGGGRLVMTTTNGTRAFAAARTAQCVLAGAFLNLHAVAGTLKRLGLPVVLVCAGTGEDFALEDALFAGALACAMNDPHPSGSIHKAYGKDLLGSMSQSRNGRRLLALGLEKDIEWCCQVDRYGTVPIMDANGLLKATNAVV